MSVTFWVPDAPRTREMVPCTYGEGYAHACTPENRCGYCADGLEEKIESPAPEINLANGNARVILEIVGLPVADLYGSLSPESMPKVRRNIVRALNGQLGAYERPSSDTRAPGCARVMVQGLDTEGIRERLKRLDAVLAYAQANKQRVTWG